MQWYDQLEKALDALTDEEEASIESRYDTFEKTLKQLQKELKYGPDDIDGTLVNRFVERNAAQHIEAKWSQAFLFHYFYLLD
jgi:hypothetical protein